MDVGTVLRPAEALGVGLPALVPITLHAGDAAAFPADAAHRRANSGRGTARLSLTVFEPRGRQ